MIMKKITFLIVYCLLFTACCSLAQVIPDSLRGIYAGLSYYKTSNDTNWAEIVNDTMYVYSLDTSTCIMHDNYGYNNPPGVTDLFITEYSFCNHNPSDSNWYHKFYDLDSLKMIDDNQVQPPPYSYTVTERFYGKQIPGSSETVGIREINIDNAINVFPNPTEDKVYINVPNATVTEITIFALTGQKVYNENLTTANTINLGFLQKGVYFLQVKTTTAALIKKIIIN